MLQRDAKEAKAKKEKEEADELKKKEVSSWCDWDFGFVSQPVSC